MEDSKRIDIANKLRHIDFSGTFDLHDKMDLISNALGCYFSETLIDDFANDLANLIEPSCCFIEIDADDPDMEKPWYKCTKCFYVRPIDDWAAWSYCPNCGCKRKL